MKNIKRAGQRISRTHGIVSGVVFVLFVMVGCGALNPTDTASAHDDAATTQPENNAQMIKVHIFNEDGELVGPVDSTKVIKTDEQWQESLTPEQYRILRNDGTENPFCGTLLDNKKEGVYTCAACGLPLFSSASKFKSGTGWPSFFQPIAETNIAEVVDTSLGVTRTEINCIRCDGHLGHVFADGPKPTGLRYCLNSESLAFTDIENVASLAENPAQPTAQRASIVLAGGCFWCVEAVLEELKGVEEAISGYAGGIKETANYKSVSSGNTGHAEAVQIIYDPSKISFTDLLRVHFATHDPTQLDRQGNDFGPQYRTAIFYRNEEEKKIAEAFLEDLRDSGLFENEIVTTLEPLKDDAFYPAEAHHQNYVCNNPMQGYVRGVALPKVEKVRKQFKDMLKEKSPLDK